ncbi:hypothetical protein BGX28_008544, partial [Mortierella sp. GBA30]
MYTYLIQTVQKPLLIGEPGFKIDSASRREMARQVSQIVREHFVELWPILNEKAAALGHANELQGMDRTKINTADLVFKFWTMNAALPECDRIAFSPQGKLTDTFMLFSETALVDLLWTALPGRPGPNDAKRFSKVRKAAEKICTRSQAQGLAKDYGALIDALFFGIQGKTSQSSYFKKRISQSTLMQGSWPSTGSQAVEKSSQSSSSAALVVSGSSTPASSSAAVMPNLSAKDSLKVYKANIIDFRKRRSEARQKEQPFNEQEPDLPASPSLQQFYVPTGMIRTNGLEFQVLAYDVRKSCPPPARFHMPETTVGIKNIEEEFATAADIQAVFGAYPAPPTVTAAGCGLNLNPAWPNMVSNLTIKRAALYDPVLRACYAMNLVKQNPPPVPRGHWCPPAAAMMQSSQSVNDIQNEMVGFGDGSSQAIVRHIQAWDNAFRKLRG